MSKNARRVDPSVVPGARPAPSPGFIEPCHPTLRGKAPSGARWIHEIKFDGYRTQAHLHHGRPAVHPRAGHDWTLRFQAIAEEAAPTVVACLDQVVSRKHQQEAQPSSAMPERTCRGELSLLRIIGANGARCRCAGRYCS
jgi:hypothetical protein